MDVGEAMGKAMMELLPQPAKAEQGGNQKEPAADKQADAVIAPVEDVAFFEKKYRRKIIGVKPKGEYSDPDQFYSAIATQLGIPDLAWTAAAAQFEWKKDDGKVTKMMVKGGPTAGGKQGTWDAMFFRFAVNPATQKPDPTTIESKIVQIDYEGGIKFFDEKQGGTAPQNGAGLNRGLGWDLLPPGSERFEVVETDKLGAEKTFIDAGYKDSPDKWEKGTEPKKIGWYAGLQYDADLANARAALADLAKIYPDYAGQGYEIAGFVWWQGHKDQSPANASRYEQNMVNLIKSLRKDYNALNAPFVLAVGCGNPGREGFGLQIAEAQLAMNDVKKHPESADNVKCLDSRRY